MAIIKGTIDVFDANGVKYTVGEGKFTYNVSGRKREPIPGTSHHSEALTNTFIEGTVLLTPGIKTKDITELKDGIIQVKGKSKKVVLSHATYSGDPVIDLSEGQIPVKYSAGPDDCEEIDVTQ